MCCRASMPAKNTDQNFNTIKQTRIEKLGKRRTWEADGENAEVTLESRVDCERTGSGVHAGHVLSL